MPRSYIIPISVVSLLAIGGAALSILRTRPPGVEEEAVVVGVYRPDGSTTSAEGYKVPTLSDYDYNLTILRAGECVLQYYRDPRTKEYRVERGTWTKDKQNLRLVYPLPSEKFYKEIWFIESQGAALVRVDFEDPDDPPARERSRFASNRIRLVRSDK